MVGTDGPGKAKGVAEEIGHALRGAAALPAAEVAPVGSPRGHVWLPLPGAGSFLTRSPASPRDYP